ncbi:PQQ-binding-like beta-propeller repeat protein [Prosthecobacter sp.]|uniref:outer membrane protein assembly factor BamB family protein n=1 Tax=Prosthecobacter sp. TaxID=1965333 RepID=UPI001D26A536|nr:PQQ-binding-like beta-propeller repeat protein [Prosthecobacter sp.]MCB1275685.1 PQQ-binding-like beta-propeller repeat protein [Prosthecobacter sp.]
MRRWLLHLVLAGTCLAETPLQLVVMDPLALQLSCTCVKGTGHRRYDLLAKQMEKQLGREVQLTFDESLALALQRTNGEADLVIGKDAVVRADAVKAGLKLQDVAALTDPRGETKLRGVFLVRQDSKAKTPADLAGQKVAIGPVEDAESNAGAKAMLKAAWRELGSMDAAALALSDGEVDAAVVSEFMPVLLEGCGKLDKGSTRTIGTTEGVPFIRLFANEGIDKAKLAQALESVASNPDLLTALESKNGFVIEDNDAWPDWRGEGRRGVVSSLPDKLPDPLPKLWSAPLTGPPMAGAAISGDFVIVPDKSEDGKTDVFRCLSLKDGHERWQLAYDAPDDLEYTNAPRATPVIHAGLVYLQGALGHLHCVDLTSGHIVWWRHVFADFKAERLNWGASVSPLVIDDKLIIAPGAKDASLVALNRKTGETVWQTPGHAAAYSAFIHAKDQIIGYDAASIGGWDVQTGKRLWDHVPPDGSDFNVTTPVMQGDQLLLATENNGARLHRFDAQNRLVPEPTMKNVDLAPDTCTPTIAASRVFATPYGELFCLELATMKTLWRQQNDMFHDHCNIVTDGRHVLLWTANGDLILLDAAADKFQPISQQRPFLDKHPDSLAHPAFAGDLILLRSSKEIACFRLTP